MKEEDRIFGDQANGRGNDFRESARAPNARSCNHRNSTETRGDRFRSWLFEFNGRIVSCRIARLVRSIRASTINAAPPTRRKSRRERNLFAWIRIDRIVFQRLWRRKKKKTKKERMRRRFIADRKSGSTAISLPENTEYGRTIYDFTVLVQRSFLIIEKFNFVGFRLTVYRSRGN